MIEMKTKKSLWLFLFYSQIMILIASLQLIINIFEDRPYWLIGIFFTLIPVFIFIELMIFLDLYKEDYLTNQGRINNKKHNKIYVTLIDGSEKKFRVSNELIVDLERDSDIKIVYYKRTKAVISIEK